MLEQLFCIVLFQYFPNICNILQVSKKVLLIAAAKLWNELPLHIRHASSMSHFKTLLKTHIFALAFHTT